MLAPPRFVSRAVFAWGMWALCSPGSASAQEEDATSAQDAPAEDVPPEGVPAGEEAPSAEAAPDELTEAGYIPGYRRPGGLGLSPQAPRSAALPGGYTVPFGGPEPTQQWEFNFIGYASAAMRLSTGAREEATEEQRNSTLHALPRTPDFYGAFGGTNAPPGSWVDLHFKYGNKNVAAHVTLTSWKPNQGASYPDGPGQGWIDQAYLQYQAPHLGDFNLMWTAGAFRNPYGGLGQYGDGQYNTAIIGVPFGVGETLTAEYQLSQDYTLIAEHGFMGRLSKAPVGAGPTPDNVLANPSLPSSWVQHAHLGLKMPGEVPFVFGLHYLTNWSQDERDQIDDGKTYWIDESERPDGRLNVYGADVRMLHNHLGNFAVAAAYADAQDAALLTGMSFFGAVRGEEMSKRFFGYQGGGTAKMIVLGAEYNFSWSKYLFYPEEFWGEGPDLITSVFSNIGIVNKSEDPDFDKRKFIKAGTEVTYRPFSWLGLSGRYDYVIPNSKDKAESFHVISPKLLFKSNWNSHETVTLSYTRWFYGSHTHGEFPLDLTREQLDNQMFALNFGIWW